jgi:hypothetical protein
VRQFGLDYAIKKAQSDNQISVNNQQVQMSKDKLAWDKDPNNPSNQQMATTKVDGKSSFNVATNIKQNIVNKINSGFTLDPQKDPEGVNRQTILKYIDNFSPALTDSDYKDLMKWFDENYK